MGFFFVYVLKLGVCLSLFYLFYRLLLSRETFHRFNRVALLGILMLSLLLPLVEVTTARQSEMNQTVLTIEQLLLMAENQQATSVVEMPEGEVDSGANSVPWVEVILILYTVGVFFFIGKYVYSLFQLYRLAKAARKERLDNHVVLLVHEQEIAPFSWMQYIVISRRDMEENGHEILIHEYAHIRNHHSIDLLIADICIFFQWFNPGAWLLKLELQNIHEYEADEAVLKEGVNAKEYQLLLIKKAVGTRLYSMANSFNHSKLKKRITMMLKEKSSPWARLKYVYVLPLAAIAVTAFARPEISEKVEEISVVKVNDLAAIVQENVLGDAVDVLQDTVTKGNEEIVVFEVVEQMPKYPGGMDALYQYLNDKTESSSVKGKAGGSVIVGFTVAESGKVKDVRVLQSDQPVLSKEAERIVSEMPAWVPGKQRGMPVAVKYSVPVRFGDIRFPENKKPLIMVDGNEMSMDAFEKINKNIIESVSVLKDSASIKMYGKRGANGVIIVNTKKASFVQSSAFSKQNANTKITTKSELTVAGTVVDEEGRPKAGVSIIVPNTTNGTITDANGRFSLKVLEGSDLWFSFVGYKTVKTAATPRMNVRMEQEVISLFPETTKRLVRVKSTTSTPLVNGVSVHGIKEGEQPLVIVDGKEASEKDALSKIAPDRIKSITILKDKSATAVYGDKAKDGVIIIEMLTDEEFQAKKNNPQRSYDNAWQLAENAAKDMEGEILYILDGKEVNAGRLQEISAKTIKSASANYVDGKIVVRLVSEK